MKKIYSILLTLFIGSFAFGQTNLTSGDIAIISIDTNAEDFMFVTFVALDAGTEIYFTDEEADGDFTIGTNEGTLLYTAPSAIAAGTVIIRPNSSGWTTTTDGNLALGNSGDGILAYQGSSVGNVTTFLHAVGEDSGDIGTFPGGFSNFLIIGADNGEYNGIRTGSPAVLMAAINDSNNWTTSGNQIIPFNDTSSFVITGSGPCNPITSFPFNEGFEGGALPTCWTQEYESASVDWVYANGNSNGLTANTGTNNALFSSSNYNGDQTKLVTPALDLSAVSNPTLTFYHTQPSFGSDQDELRLYYKTSAAGSWVLIPGQTYTSSIATWTQETVVLPNPSAEYYIAFDATSGNADGITIDDVQVASVIISNDTDAEAESSSQPAGSTISSLADTSVEAVEVFRMDFYDYGATDGLDTDVTKIRLIPHTTNTADWTDVIQGLNISDGAPVTINSVTIDDTFIDITFTSGDLTILDSDVASLSFSVYINTSNITDGSILSFAVDADNHGFEADVAGTTFAPIFSNGDFNSNDFTVEVIATELSYLVQPTDVIVSDVMSPSVEIAATDVNGNTDVNFSGTGFDIALTTDGSFDPIATTTVEALNGVSTFDNLVFGNVATGIKITASDASPLISGTYDSNTFNVIAVPVGPVVIAIQDFDGTTPEWTYTTNPSENSAACISGGDVWNVVSSLGNITVPNSTGNFFGSRDLNGASGCGTSGTGTIDFNAVTTSGYSDIIVSFDYETDGFNSSSDELSYIVSFDSTPQTRVYLCDGCNQQNNEGTISINVPNGTSTVSLQILASFDGGSDYFGVDNFKIEGVVTPTVTTYTYNGSWSPSDPNGVSTSSENILVVSGEAEISSNTSINAVTVNPGATLTIDSGVTLTVADNVTLESVSNNYSNLIYNGTITGTIKYERYVNANSNGNDLVTPPLSGQTWSDFLTTDTNSTDLLDNGNVVTTTYAFAPFDKSVSDHVNYTSATTATLNSGVGYRAATDSGTTLTFTGTPLSGATSINIISAGSSYQTWNLIGNPYPSYIVIQALLEHEVATGVMNIDILEDTSGIYGYDGNSSDGWNVITLANDDGKLMTPGQGFFVAADPADIAAYDFEFTPVMRAAGLGDDFIVGRDANPLTYLKLKANTTNNNYSTELYFNTNSSKGLDKGYDAQIFGGNTTGFALYSHLVEDNNGLPIALQSLNTSDLENTIISLGINANQGEQLILSLSEYNLPSGTEVYLEDNVANTSTLLTEGDYTLTPNADLSGAGRFYLRVTNSTLSIPHNTLDNLSIYSNNNDRTVVIAGQILEASTAKIYDIQGRVVNNVTLQSTSRQQTIDVSSLKAGVYVVQVINGTQNKTQKIIIK